MALIKCPECGHQVSDKATSCPSCANPIKATTIQATGKKWKGLQVLAGIVFAIGVVWLIASFSVAKEPSPAAAFTAFISFFVYLFARILAWWHHG
jgi:multisubunit Na+/H+ antiporter MnhE subunit